MFKSSEVGNEILCVMHGIDSSLLRNNKELHKILEQAVRKENFQIMKRAEHALIPHGYTLAFILAESHAVLSTYPEFSSLTFHLSTCRGKDSGKLVLEYLKEKLKPKDVHFISHAVPFSYKEFLKIKKAKKSENDKWD